MADSYSLMMLTSSRIFIFFSLLRKLRYFIFLRPVAKICEHSFLEIPLTCLSLSAAMRACLGLTWNIDCGRTPSNIF